jgi:multiple sugar transport system substrate-binding protein
MQDENLIPYVEGSLGRWYPVTQVRRGAPVVLAGRPARSSVQRQFVAGTTPFEFTKNYKFTTLNNENVWAKA